MAYVHSVGLGDHVVRLAYHAGHATVHALWDHPENEALRTERPDPGVLAPGDRVFVPDAESRRFEWLALDRVHEIRIELPLPMLRVQLVHTNRLVMPDRRCEAVIDGEPLTLVTDAEGRLELELGPDTREVEIRAGGHVWRGGVAMLPPVELTAGILGRLANLGYEPGPMDGDGPRDVYAFRSAVEEFQCDHDLVVDGIPGPKTRSALLRVHGA